MEGSLFSCSYTASLSLRRRSPPKTTSACNVAAPNDLTRRPRWTMCRNYRLKLHDTQRRGSLSRHWHALLPFLDSACLRRGKRRAERVHTNLGFCDEDSISSMAVGTQRRSTASLLEMDRQHRWHLKRGAQDTHAECPTRSIIKRSGRIYSSVSLALHNRSRSPVASSVASTFAVLHPQSLPPLVWSSPPHTSPPTRRAHLIPRNPAIETINRRK